MPRAATKSGLPNSQPFPESAMNAAKNVNDEGMPYAAIPLKLSRTSSGGAAKKFYMPKPPIPCRIVPAESLSGAAGDRLREDTTHVVTLARGTDLNTDDRVMVQSVEYAITAAPTYGEWESGKVLEVKPI